MQAFLAKLVERLGTEGLQSQEEVAQFLDLSPATWSRARRGKTALSPRVIQAALARYPELAFFLPEAFHVRKEHNASTEVAVA
jgi:transcriptional regulator with XRE-family HTH domain